MGPGTQLGSYEIVCALGKGGMGEVWKARDKKLGREVAIKILPDDLVDAAARRRFQQEAQMASSLNHPHILTVHDADEYEGQQYLVTEFVDGGTLKDWAKAEKRSWRQIVELLTGVGRRARRRSRCGNNASRYQTRQHPSGQERLCQTGGLCAWPS